MVHGLHDSVRDRLLHADLREALLREGVHFLRLRHRIQPLSEGSTRLEDPVVPDRLVDRLDSLGPDRGKHRAGLGRVDAALADDRAENGGLELRQGRRRLGLVLARVDVERARRVGDAGAPHRLNVRPDVLDVRDDADHEDAVHLGA